MNATALELIDRAAALIAGARAAADDADRRHLVLQARDVLSASGALVCLDTCGLLDDVLAGQHPEDWRRVLDVVHGMLTLGAEELDAAMA